MMTATQQTSAAKSSGKKASKRKPSSAQHCWPGYQPTPGKAAGEQGSCQPKAGRQKKSVRRADQKAAAASKLQKESETSP
jgi:hypothetical protein